MLGLRSLWFKQLPEYRARWLFCAYLEAKHRSTSTLDAALILLKAMV
jgi:hypothetical protein